MGWCGLLALLLPQSEAVARTSRSQEVADVRSLFSGYGCTAASRSAPFAIPNLHPLAPPGFSKENLKPVGPLGQEAHLLLKRPYRQSPWPICFSMTLLHTVGTGKPAWPSGSQHSEWPLSSSSLLACNGQCPLDRMPHWKILMASCATVVSPARLGASVSSGFSDINSHSVDSHPLMSFPLTIVMPTYVKSSMSSPPCQWFSIESGNK
ncbi:hypothetical protein TESG_08398 [Trichophyton tonsurans CBS 112818]|uniref:Uncharacterized protein n=1 Tax=Trichophyton tonsurans (strain CBS 112818) TaxID=647933 RepID=F2RWF7_TRIT1|nr:hypothetical protein TESG_08398 [Trichophyton tonsurans CBS 112818]